MGQVWVTVCKTKSSNCICLSFFPGIYKTYKVTENCFSSARFFIMSALLALDRMLFVFISERSVCLQAILTYVCCLIFYQSTHECNELTTWWRWWWRPSPNTRWKILSSCFWRLNKKMIMVITGKMQKNSRGRHVHNIKGRYTMMPCYIRYNIFVGWLTFVLSELYMQLVCNMVRIVRLPKKTKSTQWTLMFGKKNTKIWIANF